MSLLRTLVSGAAIWVLASAALTYGSIWQTQSSPTTIVATKIDGGQSETGLLLHKWDRRWELLRADGARIDLDDLSSVVISTSSSPASPSFMALWRAWVPLVVVGGPVVTWLARGFLPYPSRRKGGEAVNA